MSGIDKFILKHATREELDGIGNISKVHINVSCCSCETNAIQLTPIPSASRILIY
jgi:hypothetical protein